MRCRRCSRRQRNLWSILRLAILLVLLMSPDFFAVSNPPRQAGFIKAAARPPFGSALGHAAFPNGPCQRWLVFYPCGSTGMMVWSLNTGISRICNNLEHDLDRVNSALSRNYSTQKHQLTQVRQLR